jgi:hypothetical protein
MKHKKTRNIEDRKRSCLFGGMVSLIVVVLVFMLLPGPAYSGLVFPQWNGSSNKKDWSDKNQWTPNTSMSQNVGPHNNSTSTYGVTIGSTSGYSVNYNYNSTINSLSLLSGAALLFDTTASRTLYSCRQNLVHQ